MSIEYIQKKSKSVSKEEFSVKELLTKAYQNKVFMVGAPVDAKDMGQISGPQEWVLDVLILADIITTYEVIIIVMIFCKQ